MITYWGLIRLAETTAARSKEGAMVTFLSRILVGGEQLSGSLGGVRCLGFNLQGHGFRVRIFWGGCIHVCPALSELPGVSPSVPVFVGNM